jgi:hypothetical protein
MKILIVANNLSSWKSWPEKINNIRQFFLPKIDFQIDLKHVSFADVPFDDDLFLVNDKWYDENIIPFTDGYDICVFATVKSITIGGLTCLRGKMEGIKNFTAKIESTAQENMLSGGRPGEVPTYYDGFEHTVEHEILHALFLMAYGTNNPPYDTTHKNDYINLNLALAIKDLPASILTPKERNVVMQTIVNLYTKIRDLLVTQTTIMPPKITKLAECIRDFEGQPGDLNYRNNNAGNCKFHHGGYLPKYGDVKCDKRGFAIFPTYEQGWLYLQNMLLNWAKGSKKDYTVLELIKEYAPSSDNNDPYAYAKNISQRMGLSASTKLKDLLS